MSRPRNARMFRYDPDRVSFSDINYGGDEIAAGIEFYHITVEHIHDGRHENQYSRVPGLTNMSHEKRLHGWLGTTNDWSAEAHGKWRVIEVNPQRGRFYAVPVEV